MCVLFTAWWKAMTGITFCSHEIRPSVWLNYFNYSSYIHNAKHYFSI